MKESPPKNHQWVETEDGSFTLYSDHFQEACHSTSGAKQETLLHYLKGCQVLEKNKLKEIQILEVGFGLGLGFVTTKEALQNFPYPFHFLSVEIDEELVQWVFNRLQKEGVTTLSTQNGNIYSAQFQNGSLTVLAGDARKTLPGYLETHSLKIDVIYQDAFSPKRNPILWTRQWFELLKKYSHPDVTLSTYSSSSSIRKSLIEAGWKINKGEKFGPKRTSTRATLEGTTDPEILLHLERSPVSALTDENAEEYANEKQALRTSKD